MGVQKHLFVSECAILKLLNKERTFVGARNCAGSFIKNFPDFITCSTYTGNEIINVQFFQEQEFFVGDLQAWITFTRKAL